jgi:hypothetical protein
MSRSVGAVAAPASPPNGPRLPSARIVSLGIAPGDPELARPSIDQYGRLHGAGAQPGKGLLAKRVPLKLAFRDSPARCFLAARCGREATKPGAPSAKSPGHGARLRGGLRGRGGWSPTPRGNGWTRGFAMSDQISPKFHAELIVVLCDEFQDLREVTARVGVLLSAASAEHIDAVGKYLPIDVMRVLPRRLPWAA